MIARVIALGQRTAGDDGIGPAILDRLRAIGPPGVELVEIADASAVIPLIATPALVVIVDAVVIDGRTPGDVVELDASALPPRTRTLSTHGLDLSRAIAIGRAVAPAGATAPRLRLVGVVIAPPDRVTAELSPSVGRAIAGAVQAVLAEIRAVATRDGSPVG